MWIAAKRLVERLRNGRARAEEAQSVRIRVASKSEGRDPTLVDLAARIAEQKEELHAAMGGLSSCHTCAKGHQAPHGSHDGGFCCGGATSGVFTDDEVALLRLSGSTQDDFPLPPGEQAGCAFRGRSGCSLTPRHRPVICVHYMCRELEAEQVARGTRDRIRALRTALTRNVAEFRTLLEQDSEQSLACEASREACAAALVAVRREGHT